ncbi:MAG: DNRLRE domain-containing protein, partial [Planctomycetota bacterium]
EPVIEALQDFQDYPGGGQGWLRIITFDPDAGQIQFQTYSPVLDQFQTERPEDPGIGGRASEFEIAIDFATRFQFAEPAQPPLNPFQTLRFRDGSNGYNGTRDTEVRQDDPDTNLGAAPEVTIDADDDGAPGLQRTQGLIRFDNFIGAAGQRVRPGDFIGSAIINFNVNNPGSGFDVHEVTQNWAPNFTWNRFGNGLNPGVDVAPTPEYRLGLDNGNSNIPTGPLEIYVTQMVQRWADGRGQPFGTAFLSLPAGTNGLDLDSSESASPPELVVTTLLPKFRAVRFTQSVDGYNGAIDTQLTQSEPNTSGAGFTSFSADASDSGGQNHILIRFDDIFGTGPDRVGPFDVIAKAYITLTADDPGDGASAFRLLQPFTAGATWNNSFGGDGVQADNIEAVAMPAGGAAGAFGLGEIDVTESIVAWLQGATNHGWALLPSGTNGWDVASSESGPQLRPSLTVIIDRCVADLVEPFDAQPDGNDLLELIDRVDGGLASGDWNADSETDIF